MSPETHFILSQSDSRPMYLQIIEQIKNKVAVGDWETGYKLPSIREFAVALNVSVITVKRAYMELETMGVIVTQQGKGSYIAGGIEMGIQLRNQEIDQCLRELIDRAIRLDFGKQELIQRLSQLFDELNKLD